VGVKHVAFGDLVSEPKTMLIIVKKLCFSPDIFNNVGEEFRAVTVSY
jgi:hypothetical protein